jgi:hypothetical protein
MELRGSTPPTPNFFRLSKSAIEKAPSDSTPARGPLGTGVDGGVSLSVRVNVKAVPLAADGAYIVLALLLLLLGLNVIRRGSTYDGE